MFRLQKLIKDSNPEGHNRKAPRTFLFWGLVSGAAGRNRTHDPLVRSQVLYPAELQPHFCGESGILEIRPPPI